MDRQHDTDPKLARSSLGDVLVQHLPLGLTLFLFMTIAIKLLVVAHGDVTTAAGLLKAARPAEVALGILLVNVSPLLPLLPLAVLLVLQPTFPQWALPRRILILTVFLISSEFLAAVTLPWPGFIYLSFVALLFTVMFEIKAWLLRMTTGPRASAAPSFDRPSSSSFNRSSWRLSWDLLSSQTGLGCHQRR